MQRYFRHEAVDIGFGPGTAYLEFDGEWAVRQVEVYGERWLSSLDDYHPGIGPGLVDQPFEVLGLGPEHAISKEEFEAVWREAVRRHDRRGGKRRGRA